MRRIVLAIVCLALVSNSAWAQDDITVKSKAKSIKGTVKEENSRGVVILGVKDMVPAEDIVDIIYEVNPIKVRLNSYRPATIAEKDSTDPKLPDAKKRDKLAEAIKKFEEARVGVEATEKFARRHIEYKIAFLLARQGQDDVAAVPKAIAKLKAFTSAHANSWQIGRALQLLATLQLEQKLFADAEDTFKALAQADVPDSVRQEADLAAAKVSLRAGNHAAALKKLDALIAAWKGPKDNPLVGRARVVQAECLLADKDTTAKGRTVLHEIIRDTSDPGLKAAAYNTLGESYFKAGAFKEARYPFLWVDVVYHQDKSEHAKALYYLWKTFKELGEAERAQECLDNLLNDRQFVGLEYHGLALRENKS